MQQVYHNLTNNFICFPLQLYSAINSKVFTTIVEFKCILVIKSSFEFKGDKNKILVVQTAIG